MVPVKVTPSPITILLDCNKGSDISGLSGINIKKEENPIEGQRGFEEIKRRRS
jgi:hypothetical protein